MTKRKLVSQDLERIPTDFFTGSLEEVSDKLLDFISSTKKVHTGFKEFDIEITYYDIGNSMKLVGHREENDQELAFRLRAEKKNSDDVERTEKRIEKAERLELKRLQKKYG